MKIAFVRGPFLNPWELQTYAPLAQRHSLIAVGADWQFYRQPITGFPQPKDTPHLWFSGASRLHPGLPVCLNRLRSWTFGESYGLAGLSEAVGDAEILHSAETHSTLTHQCLQLRKSRRCKVLATVWENLTGMGEFHPRRRARKKAALRELDGFLAVTETSRRMLLNDGAPEDRIAVIPMAVDLNHFKPGDRAAFWSERWRLGSDEKVVLFIGRWVKEKGVEDLLEAVPPVIREIGKPVRFVFVGAGPLEGLLRKAARLHPHAITLEPFRPYDRLPDLHNMADVFVLPSKPAPKWQEQFGYVLAESMACGKPIVTTRTGSIPDVVGDAALLVAPGDIRALAGALSSLLASPADQKRLGQAALQHARRQFDPRANSAKIESFYDSLLKGSS